MTYTQSALIQKKRENGSVTGRYLCLNKNIDEYILTSMCFLKYICIICEKFKLVHISFYPLIRFYSSWKLIHIIPTMEY